MFISRRQLKETGVPTFNDFSGGAQYTDVVEDGLSGEMSRLLFLPNFLF